MAITPLETAAFLPKSVEAGIVRQTELLKPANEQIALNAAMKEQEKKESTQTKMLEKTDQPEYRYDGRSNGGSGGMLYERDQKNKKKKKEQMDGDQPISGINIRI